MNSFKVNALILLELVNAKKKHPGWPEDPVHAVAILNEEAGELTQACLDFTYDDKSIEQAMIEAAQCGAMVIRFLSNVEKYKRVKSKGVI